ncbi:Flagellar FliJ protein [Candidatus Methylobacter favarea]|uniref:Flagellar FliJ protein n=1 Tax=Candidatus Methylobacter favarea TaxID=2707345 RepID=A0A8S0YAG0_9GAMM|nr:flagellar export protein FliJ [Candidatus Methylobacter favarea]CAA9891805.1 Flagellar FliJ protein [Candidatus Methylobacter favarea]
MKKSRRIKTIVELKAAQEKNALEAWGAAQKKLLAMQIQVQGLRKYRQDYQDKFDQRAARGVNVEQLLEFRSFIDKLNKAISGQEQALRLGETEVLAKRKLWEALRQHTRSLQKVCDSALAVEAREEARSEQRELDERAARTGRNSSGGMGNA